MRRFKRIFTEPYLALGILLLVVGGCIFANQIGGNTPNYMDLAHINEAPSKLFLFGTDPLGRNIFAMIWHGGRVSIFIGIFATAVSTMIGIVYGCISGVAGQKIDRLMMRGIDLILSIPSILLIIFAQAMLGNPNVFSISIVIGLCSWMPIAKVVRSEVLQIAKSDYVLAARYAGGGFFYILWRHFIPNLISAIAFMVVTNIGSAIGMEATLSFLGIGLPLEVISWGSMLSLAEKALLTNSWWFILIPGVFLIVTLLCINDIADYGRRKNNREYSHL